MILSKACNRDIAGIFQVSHKYQSVAQGPFTVGTWHRAEAQTRPMAPKVLWSPSVLPKKVQLRHQVINQALWSHWGRPPGAQGESVLVTWQECQASSVPMSDGIDLLPPKLRHIRPALCIRKHGRPNMLRLKCRFFSGVKLRNEHTSDKDKLKRS